LAERRRRIDTDRATEKPMSDRQKNTLEKPKRQPKPPWLKRRLPSGPAYGEVASLLKEGGLNTVCQEAQCPNQWECFSKRTATFMIMGSRCTRNCRFCAVAHGPSGPPDEDEPARVAEAARRLGLKYIVITSVTRDDLPDGGARFFAETIRAIRQAIPHAVVEILIPDFQGDENALDTVLDARPNVLNHNLETVSRLYPVVRPDAIYHRSLQLLKRAGKRCPALPTKSGIMLGLGETPEEIHTALADLRDAGCSILTLGQYLQPSNDHLPVARFIRPEEFEKLREKALGLGFSEVASGPFVRSSYQAHTLYQAAGADGQNSQEKP